MHVLLPEHLEVRAFTDTEFYSTLGVGLGTCSKSPFVMEMGCRFSEVSWVLTEPS